MGGRRGVGRDSNDITGGGGGVTSSSQLTVHGYGSGQGGEGEEGA
jgi:hypothetical protein